MFFFFLQVVRFLKNLEDLAKVSDPRIFLEDLGLDLAKVFDPRISNNTPYFTFTFFLSEAFEISFF
jgi:hypothetical protein